MKDENRQSSDILLAAVAFSSVMTVFWFIQNSFGYTSISNRIGDAVGQGYAVFALTTIIWVISLLWKRTGWWAWHKVVAKWILIGSVTLHFFAYYHTLQ